LSCSAGDTDEQIVEMKNRRDQNGDPVPHQIHRNPPPPESEQQDHGERVMNSDQGEF